MLHLEWITGRKPKMGKKLVEKKKMAHGLKNGQKSRVNERALFKRALCSLPDFGP